MNYTAQILRRIALFAAAGAAFLTLAACQADPFAITEVSADGMTVAGETGAASVSFLSAPAPTSAPVQNGVFLNVRDLGAAGDGVTDDTDAFKQAIELTEESGGTIYVPAGTYKLTKRLSIKADDITLCGDGNASRLIYYCDQKRRGIDRSSKSLIYVTGSSNFVCRDLYLEFQGEFFPEFGESYAGDANGICVFLGHNILIENMEITGFNHAGIFVSGLDDDYSTDITVQNCYLHHNRVAGVLYGYVDGILITDSIMEYQGSPLDGGTGYGCTGYSGAKPKNVRVINNQCNYNYRKGIDLHAGENAVIEGNTCNGNRLYGIYTEGPYTNRVIIKNNIISNMGRVELDIWDPYTWISGICVGPNKSVADTTYDFQVIGNIIEDFGLEKGSAYGIQVYGPGRNGSYTFKDNIITGTEITRFITAGSGAAAETDRNSYIIEGNRFYAERVDSTPITLGAFHELSMTNNVMEIADSSGCSGALIRVDNSGEYAAVIKNNVIDAEHASDAFSVLTMNDTVVFDANIFNGDLIAIVSEQANANG